MIMLLVKTISVTMYQQNSRILMDESQSKAIIVDPGGDVALILEQLPSKYIVESIWITHSHIDHVSGVALLLAELSKLQNIVPEVISHPDDQINRDHLPMQSKMMNFAYSGDFSITQYVDHGDRINCGNYEFNVLHTPGHAIGHISFFLANDDNQFNTPLLIAGDALFRGSIGRTDLPGGDHALLLTSIRQHLFTLPEQTVVLSGHGLNTTIGEEVKTNPFLIS